MLKSLFVKCVLAFVCLYCTPSDIAFAQRDTTLLKVAAPISSHMVLQQGKPISVWGVGTSGSKVTVTFGENSSDAIVGQDDRWKATLPAQKVSTQPSKMTIKSDFGETITVSDILVGEVWMCSGQSNMAWPMKRCGDADAIEQASYPEIRIFKTAQATAETPQSDCVGIWQTVTPETAAEFSAVGYHFGRELHKSLGIPIGLIDTSWGGKPVEAFASREKLETVESARPLLDEWDAKADSFDVAKAKKNFDTAMKKYEERKRNMDSSGRLESKPVRLRKPTLAMTPKRAPNFPAAIYNQKIAPWTNFPIAGSIWYQGESNRNRAVQYKSLLSAMIEDWRDRWNDEFPFYIVQLANFQKPSVNPGIPDSWAELQDSQKAVAQTLPNCGIAVINDIGAANDIHPKNKKDVGYRLSLLALKNKYNKDLSVWSSPLYDSHQVTGNHVVITFDHVGDGLKSRDGLPLKRFEIAGKDRKWHWADASIESLNTVKVSSDAVPEPVAVRYAWAANPKGSNLVNSAGLPASLFRTDDWPLSTANNFTLRNPMDTENRMRRQGFKPLFNSKNLDGWRNPFDYGNAEVVGSEIHLTANKKFFLVTEKEYSDFQLLVDIKLPQGQANSGIMFRCHVEPNRVFGYQAECDGSDRRWSAGLYDEGRRGWIWPSKKGESKVESQAHFAKPEIRGALKRDRWNQYRITCHGNQIKIELNGVLITKLSDDTDAKGFIGIQHHGEKGQTYRFRNLYIKELTADRN